MWPLWKSWMVWFFSEYPSQHHERCRSHLLYAAVLIKTSLCWGARQSSGKKRKLLMEIKVPDCPEGSRFQTLLMWSSDRLRDEQGRVVHVWFKGCFCHELRQRSPAFIGLLVYFHFLTRTEHPLKVNKSLIFSYFKTWPTESAVPVIYWRLSFEAPPPPFL